MEETFNDFFCKLSFLVSSQWKKNMKKQKFTNPKQQVKIFHGRSMKQDIPTTAQLLHNASLHNEKGSNLTGDLREKTFKADTSIQFLIFNIYTKSLPHGNYENGTTLPLLGTLFFNSLRIRNHKFDLKSKNAKLYFPFLSRIKIKISPLKKLYVQLKL